MNITVIGVGKLGLGFALLLEKSGYNVLGVDIFPEYVEKLNTKAISFAEPGYNELLQNAKNFRVTLDLSEGIQFSDLIFIIVQTPNGGGDRFYDHSILSNVLSKINKMKPENKDIIIGCTVMPKYIDEVGNTLISDCINSSLSYNPEFVAQGDIVKGFENPDIILLGTHNKKLYPIITEIYEKMTLTKPKFCFMNPLESEVVKISLNGFITTKISYANMISDLCDKLSDNNTSRYKETSTPLKADKHIVLDAIGSDSRIGNKYFRPGYSFGGPCFPRDTKALDEVMHKNNICTSLLLATTSYNEEHIRFQANQMMSTGAPSHFISNVCYKENSTIPLIEESAKLKIAKYLVKNGKTVFIKETPEIIEEVKKEYGNLFQYIPLE